MSAGAYALGLISLAVVAGALVAGARAVRKSILPCLGRAPAALADAVLALAALVLVAELLGVVGLLTRGWLVAACAVAGLAAVAIARRRPAASVGGAVAEPPEDRPLTIAALGAGLLVMAQWGAGTGSALAIGMAMPDTIWYHLPLAAEFAQEGSLTGLHYSETAPITVFYPANAELFHAVGMVLFGRDVLSPFLNLGLVALALLGGWCLGRRFGTGALGLVAMAIALSVPIFWSIQAGQAGNDVAGLAFLAAALGLLAHDGRSRAVVALAGLAAGLALGTKLSTVAPAVALTLAVPLLAARGERLRTTGVWCLGLVATGGFWYARNLFHTGNPLPWVEVDLGPIQLDSPPRPLTEGLEFPVIHYATDYDVVRDFFIQSLDNGLGWAWPLLLALAVAAPLAALAAGPRWPRAVGAVAVLSGLAYLFTPNGAGGREGVPWGFELNLRYAVPALAIGLGSLALLPAVRERRRARIAFGVLAALLVFNLFSPEGLEPRERLEALAWAASGAAVAAVVFLAWRSGSRAARAGALAALASGFVVTGWFVQRDYLRDRYAAPGPNVAEASVWGNRAEDTRIGVLGALPSYPLYGADLSNRVEQLGRRGPDGAFGRYRSCASWRRAVNAGRYRYLVLSPVRSPNLPPSERVPAPRELRWTSTDPAARAVIEEGDNITTFRLAGPMDPAGCGRPTASAKP